MKLCHGIWTQSLLYYWIELKDRFLCPCFQTRKESLLLWTTNMNIRIKEQLKQGYSLIDYSSAFNSSFSEAHPQTQNSYTYWCHFQMDFKLSNFQTTIRNNGCVSDELWWNTGSLQVSETQGARCCSSSKYALCTSGITVSNEEVRQCGLCGYRTGIRQALLYPMQTPCVQHVLTISKEPVCASH